MDRCSSKLRRRHSKASPRSSNKVTQRSNPESPLLTQHKNVLCDSPDPLRSPRLGQSPLVESVSDIHSKVSSASSDSNDWRVDRKRNSTASDPEIHNRTKLFENQSSESTTGSLFYVRLGVVNEDEVFVRNFKTG